MSEIIQSECVITGDTSNKNDSGHLNDTIGVKSNRGKPPTDMKGKKIGRLLFLEHIGTDKSRRAIWKCLCDCGTYKNIRGSSVRNGNVQSCGCLQREMIAKHYNSTPYKWLLARIENTGSFHRKRGWKMINSITYSDILDFVKIKNCHYCSEEIIWYPHGTCNGKQVSGAYNLDRKDNSIGYTKDNCVVCCAICNYFKGDRFSYDEMLEIGKTFRRLKEARKCKGQSWVQHYSRLSPNRKPLVQTA